jgi:hypothetical protein
MFLAQSIMQNGIPFEVKRVSITESNPFQPLSEKELFAKLETSRLHAAEGKMRYNGASSGIPLPVSAPLPSDSRKSGAAHVMTYYQSIKFRNINCDIYFVL